MERFVFGRALPDAVFVLSNPLRLGRCIKPHHASPRRSQQDMYQSHHALFVVSRKWKLQRRSIELVSHALV